MDQTAAQKETKIRADEAASNPSLAKIDMKLEVVIIPVSDVERAKEFYKMLGWRPDITPPGVVQFTPPGSGCSVQFGGNRTSAAPGSAQGRAASPQEQPRTFRVPFHTVNGMVLPEASLLLDTGANYSILSPQAAGLTTVKLRALQATQVGTGAEGDYIAREVDLRLDRRHWVNRRALVMDLSDASKRMGPG